MGSMNNQLIGHESVTRDGFLEIREGGKSKNYVFTWEIGSKMYKQVGLLIWWKFGRQGLIYG